MGKVPAIGNVLFPLGILFAGGLAVFVFRSASFGWTQAIALPGVLCVIGVCLLAVAKIPHFRAGRFATFGPAALPSWAQAFYWLGLFLVLFGTVTIIALSASPV